MMIQGAIPAQTTADNDSKNQARLADAAQQFEGMLLQEMLKPMRTGNSNGTWSSEEQGSDGSEETINSFGVQAVATAIAKGGGLGIARQVIQQVTAEHDKMQPKTASMNSHRS